ncbi:TPA: phosphate acetyltransferase [Candidatus Poribacteria bacterium]|nr:phosphate acetyltransferase [Candidatus Poribacteria bacterium]
MSLIEQFKNRAKENPMNIVFPEGDEDRILRAAEISLKEKIAYPVILGDEDKIRKQADDIDVNLDGIEIINPARSPKMAEYASAYCESRDVTESLAKRILRRALYFGAMMVNVGDCDGMVAGSKNTTASVVTAGNLVGMREGFTAPSSFFMMVIPNCPYGENGALIYADAGVNEEPTAAQLAEIALASADSARTLLRWEPRVAMLSFSTKGSAAHALTDKVIEATKIAKESAPDLLIDGELQADTALVPEIAQKKIKGESDVAGKANILIFPDLNAGNIAYKLTQYLAHAEAYGPLLQGFAKPVNDLSRGSSVEDIVGVTAITVVEAQ